MKISAFIIAKNEEARIATALKSLVSFCDEIIVVDTGSKDKTKQIALNYTDKIFKYIWVEDFSAARNFALKKCTGDWIIYLDADDEIEPAVQNLIKETITNASPETLGFHVNYRYAKDKDLLTPRIFRNNIGLKFVMPVHEYLDIPDDQKRKFTVVPGITILHNKAADENPVTLQRNLKILQHALPKDPKNHHLNFFLAREKYNLGQYAEAQKILAELANNPPIADKSFTYLVFTYLGLCFQKLNNGRMAIEAFHEAFDVYDHLAEPLIYAADTWLYLMKNSDEAKILYAQALKVKKPLTGFPVNPDFYHDYPQNQLKKIEKLNRPIALICGYYGVPNIGDELMLASIIKSHPNHRIIVASHDVKNTQLIHNVEAVPHHHPYFDEALRQAQLVIIGGGTLFHDQGLRENSNIEYYCGIINSAVMKGKTVILLGIGVDKISLDENRELIKHNFQECSEIAVRDELSKTRLIKYGVTNFQIRVMEDLACALKPSEYITPPPPAREISSIPEISAISGISSKSETSVRPLIGINLCPPIVEGESTYTDKIEKELIPFIAANKDNSDFIFIPGAEQDLQYIQYIKEKAGLTVPALKPAINENYIQSYFEILNKCDKIIAARFHLILLGHLLNKPTSALPYAEKVDQLIQKYNIPRFKKD